MHEEVWLKNSLWQNDSYENLDNFSYMFWYVKKIIYDKFLHSLSYQLLQNHLHWSIGKFKVYWFKPSLVTTNFLSLTLTVR